jgi:hypothetical protein
MRIGRFIGNVQFAISLRPQTTGRGCPDQRDDGTALGFTDAPLATRAWAFLLSI